MTIPLIIHHANCPDGFGAAWWLGRHLGEHDKHPAMHDDAEWPSCDGREVYVVDFCYPTEIMDAIHQDAERVVVLDHHQTALALLESSTLPAFISIEDAVVSDVESGYLLDITHSGVGLVAMYVGDRWRHEGQAAPSWLSNIQDRDLWKFELSETPAVFAAITARPYTVEAWDQMMSLTPGDLEREGTGIEMYRQKLIAGAVATRHEIEIDGHLVWATACPYAIGSDVAHELCLLDPERGFAAYYVVNDLNKADFKFGLRSLQDGMDVAKVAENYPPGGGHKHAAGFRSIGSL